MPPLCKDCAYVRHAPSMYVGDGDKEHCGVKRVSRPLASDQRAPDGDCGRDAKLLTGLKGK